jgi:hypothetical protein
MADRIPPSRQQPYAVTALFDQTEAVEAALVGLVRAGVPRDLIDVVVSPEAHERFYAKQKPMTGRAALSYGGRGGLIGLAIGVAISFSLIALPGFQSPGLTAIVQLLGPNFTTVVGALIGAAYGLRVKRPAEPRHARAAEEPSAIVIAVLTRSRAEAEQLVELLANNGGRSPRIEKE